MQSKAYSQAIAEFDSRAKVIERPCPLFVALAEEGWADSDVAQSVADEYLSEFRNRNLGALVLGCTHYPILRNAIAKSLSEEVPLIDS